MLTHPLSRGKHGSRSAAAHNALSEVHRGALQDAKLGHALRYLPSRSPNANRLWLCCCLLALNLSALICDISPAAAVSGQTVDERTPQRRHAKTVRRILFCVPGRIVRTARRIIVRLPDSFPHFELLNATYHAGARAARTLEPGYAPPRNPAPPRRENLLTAPSLSENWSSAPECAVSDLMAPEIVRQRP
jgi:hypothetical protein